MTPEQLLRDAEDLIESWWCDLDQVWHARLGEADETVRRMTDEARAEADRIVTSALAEGDRIIAAAHATAGEHADVIRALTTAEHEAAGEQLAALREAVDRLRTELSRVVDAAFDALPAMEATSEAIDRAMAEVAEAPSTDSLPVRPRRFLRRLLWRRS